MPGEILRPVQWIASSKKDYLAFPEEVQQDLGFALYRVQTGAWWSGAKPLAQGVLRGLGICELRGDHDGDTYRVVYLARFAEVVYVLHAFQKKSTHGIATPQREIALIRSRYDAALEHYREAHGPQPPAGRRAR
jgi:phage-related protein